ncbi:DUF3263 domain-containing protein [Cnuibacter physcomitrellae]|uniref:DUF3263 domain-containing protein n=1 Tax=Cnuibacter physcomitrellae TaxID=1619308 RepID=UPI0035C75953
MAPNQILAFEHETTGWPEGCKTDQIRRRYGIRPARYAQTLNAVLDSRAGLEANPVERVPAATTTGGTRGATGVLGAVPIPLRQI